MLSLCVDALREHQARQDRERAESLPPWPDLGLVFVTTIGTPMDGLSRAQLTVINDAAKHGDASREAKEVPDTGIQALTA